MDPAFGRRSVVGEIGGDGAAATGGFAPAAEKYGVLGPIGQGGMGEVLLVQDRDLRRDVAMKVLRSELADQAAMRRKFVAEAQATSQLEHPGIPPVHDIGVDGEGRVWFTMKIVRGRTLSEVLKDLFLGRRETKAEYTVHRLMTVMERICEAVHFAHEKGVIHRDLKPDNVMLGEFGEVHVMDWGIAKVSSTSAEAADVEETISTVDTDARALTQVGTVTGTIPYMSPEQAQGQALDRRSDVWSLGAILYEMLTLMPAFEGQGVAMLLKVRSGDFPAVEMRNPRRPVHESLARLCRRAMSKDPVERPATAHEIAVELRSFLDGRAEKERRHREAESLAAHGREAMVRFVAAKDSIDSAEREAERIAGQFKPWQSAEEKRPLRLARKAVEDAKRAVVLAFAETTKLLEAAIVAEAENPTARGLLADLWRGRLDDAEHCLDGADAAHALTMLFRYDDGRFAALVAGDGSLELTSDPPRRARGARPVRGRPRHPRPRPGVRPRNDAARAGPAADGELPVHPSSLGLSRRAVPGSHHEEPRVAGPREAADARGDRRGLRLRAGRAVRLRRGEGREDAGTAGLRDRREAGDVRRLGGVLGGGGEGRRFPRGDEALPGNPG